MTDQSTNNLQRLAVEQGLSPPSKINPLEEAIMTARLAQRARVEYRCSHPRTLKWSGLVVIRMLGATSFPL